jgi:Na+-driven multidrug efflux pump
MLTDDIIMFLRYTALFYPAVPLGMLTSALFRGINQGMNALIVTIIRAVVLQVSIAYILGVGFGYGLEGVWMGIVSGNLMAGIAVTFPWGIVSLRRFRQQVESSPLKIDEP